MVGRVPKDRPPAKDELDACAPYLDAQVTAVEPKVIVTLGGTALRRLLGPTYQVKRDDGRVVQRLNAAVVPTFHPSAIHWRTGRRAATVRDLALARTLIAQ